MGIHWKRALIMSQALAVAIGGQPLQERASSKQKSWDVTDGWRPHRPPDCSNRKPARFRVEYSWDSGTHRNLLVRTNSGIRTEQSDRTNPHL
jgi:hypothetical protein